MLSLRRDLPTVLILLAMFVLAAVAWPLAPDRMAVHFGPNGQPDGWGGRFEGLVLMPLVALGVFVLMAVVPRIDPGRANYRRFAGVYALLRMVVVGFLAVIYAGMVLPVFGVPVNVANLGSVATGVMFLVLGGVMGKVRPNWCVGIRTPWTLSSKRSWVRTHRLGGWLFLALGLAIMGVAVASPGAAYFVMLGGTIGVVAVVAGYSYFQWRADPDKQSPAGTRPAEEE